MKCELDSSQLVNALCPSGTLIVAWLPWLVGCLTQIGNMSLKYMKKHYLIVNICIFVFHFAGIKASACAVSQLLPGN